MLPLTLRLGWATLHGWNLMDTPYAAPEGLLHWADLAAAHRRGDQTGPRACTREGWDDYADRPRGRGR